jgi:uncharacterized alkaline shock family protein YloU
MVFQKEKNELLPPRYQELDLPDTTLNQSIDDKVFHGIILKALQPIQGISLQKANVFQTLIGKKDKIFGISTVQDDKTQSLKVRLEVDVKFGVFIPEKAEEIQMAVIEEITKMTGLRVSEVQVIFKDLIPESKNEQGE